MPASCTADHLPEVIEMDRTYPMVKIEEVETCKGNLAWAEPGEEGRKMFL